MTRQLPGIVGLASSTNEVYCRIMQEEAQTICAGDDLEFIMHSINFRQAVQDLRAGDVGAFTQRIVDSAAHLMRGGADFLVISSNTSHIAVDEIATAVALPLLDIRDTVVAAVRTAGHSTVGVIGTSQTIHAGLYDRTLSRHGIDVLTPAPHTMKAVDRVIFDELVHGIADGEAVGIVSSAVRELTDIGAEIVVLACTDLTHIAPALGNEPVLDSTTIHARAAAQKALYS